MLATTGLSRAQARIVPLGDDDCWPWPGAKARHGYGKVADRTSGRCRTLVVPRLLVADRDGLDYEDQTWKARHSCDFPPCCNLAHLSPGSSQENSGDAVKRKRHAARERHGMAKLTEEKVAEIRNLRAAGVPRLQVAERFGVHPEHVTRITAHRIWA